MDAELTDRARRGDAAAVASIVEQTRPRLMAVAYSILRDHDQADEATQRALIAIWQHLPSLRDVERYDAWSYRLVVNACNAELRRGRRIRSLTPELEVRPSFADDLGLVADRDQLDRAFLRLPTRQRAVVALRFHLGLSTERVAEVMGLPVGTVHSRLHRAMDVLRSAIEADGRGSPDGRPTDHPRPAGAITRARPWRPEALLSWAGGLAARRIVVSSDGWGDATTITEALDLAEDGDIILVRPGRYHETPVVRKHVAIVGDGNARDIVVDFRDGEPSHWCGDRHHPLCTTVPVGFLLEGANARLSNLTLAGPQHGVGIITRGGTPTVTHSSGDFDGLWPGMGHNHHFLYVDGASGGTISDCTTRAHVFIKGSSSVIEHNDLGASLMITGNGTRPLVRENAIVIRQRTPICLAITEGAEPTIERNEISWIDGAAIAIWDSAQATVRDNLVRDSQTGISVFAGGGGSLEGNDIEARTTGILVHDADPFVSRNAVRGARATPLVVAGSGHPVFEGNHIEGDGPEVRAVGR